MPFFVAHEAGFRVLHNSGDGPHFYQWQRRFLDAPEDARWEE